MPSPSSKVPTQRLSFAVRRVNKNLWIRDVFQILNLRKL